MKTVYLVWIDNGLQHEDHLDWIADIRTDNKKSAEKAGQVALDIFVKSSGLKSANYYVITHTTNKISI